MKTLSFLTPLFLVTTLFSAHAKTLDRVAAVVGEEPILLSEVDSLQKRISQSAGEAKLYELSTTSSKRSVLEKLIEAKIISLSLKELGAEISSEEIESRISSIASQNNITKTQLEAALRREGVNLDEYRATMRAQLEKKAIFDRELRQSSTNPSEAELRALYERAAGREVNLSLLDAAAGASASAKRALTKEWTEIVGRVKSGKMSFEDAKKQLSPYSLDWVSSKSLNSAIAKVLEGAAPASVLGPVDVEGRPTLVFYEASRKGSDEAFEKMRPQLESQARAQGFDNKLALWLERRKQELHIVVNNL